MKVYFKLANIMETIENVSVDDKCFPVVAGIHPYSASTRFQTPLTQESALWFKTLALDSIYIDCNRRLIFWLPILNDQEDPDVVIRRKVFDEVPLDDFIPSSARPLFEDSNLYDFDASLKEMMGKCVEVVNKYLSKRSLSTVDFNASVANLLHVYILPSVVFTINEIYCLSRTRCLIEERLSKAESDILKVVKDIELLELSLKNLKENLLQKENFDSERYLRTCNREFLATFVKRVEIEVKKLQEDLDIEQGKVNRARQLQEHSDTIRILQQSRDLIHQKIEELIPVREAIKNVISRKEKRKRKLKKVQIIDSCFHNVYLELDRRLQQKYVAMDNLCVDKVNISAAREATLTTIQELNNNRGSDRSTRFEPNDFADFKFHKDTLAEKSDIWLTFQERLSKVMGNMFSHPLQVHKLGCNTIKLQINCALSEFRLAQASRNSALIDDPIAKCDEDCVAGETSQNSELAVMIEDGAVLLRPRVRSDVKMARRDTPFHNSNIDSANEVRINHNLITVAHASSKIPDKEPDTRDYPSAEKNVTDTSSDRLSRISSMKFVSNHFDAENLNSSFDPNCKESQVTSSISHVSSNVLGHGCLQMQSRVQSELEDCHLDGIQGVHDEQAINNDQGQKCETENDLEKDTAGKRDSWEVIGQVRRTMVSEQLAQAALMTMVENIRSMVHMHFKDMEDHLLLQLGDSLPDQRELTWKAYERYFCQEVLPSMTEMYATALEAGAKAAHKELCRTSLQDILSGDKILDLFFKTSESGDRMRSSSSELQSCGDKISMARTLSDLSLDVRHCSVKDLYKLANSDSKDLCRRFQLDLGEDEEDKQLVGNSRSSESSSSGDSVKTSDLFDMATGSTDGSDLASSPSNMVLEGNAATMEDKFLEWNSETQSSNKVAATNSPKVLGCDYDERLVSNSHQVLKLLDPVLTPFRKYVTKCVNAQSFLDKVRYLTKAIGGLVKDISRLYGPEHQAACDEVITMLVLALTNMPEDVFAHLYVNLRLLTDVLPHFLNGTLCDYNLVSLYASYDYLFNRNVCHRVIKRYGRSFKIKL